ncbi:hypothetical protein F1880_006511 [Penicillium rolfsii]|nr:hypothetical protein F1880_006511 [Penicillium rolfsii]
MTRMVQTTRSSRYPMVPSMLSNGKFGGFKLNDMVISYYQCYKLNGYKSGYKMPDLSSYIDRRGTECNLIFQNGIQLPSFFCLPICVDLVATMRNINKGPD